MLLVMLLFYFPFYYVRMDVVCGWCVRSVCLCVCVCSCLMPSQLLHIRNYNYFAVFFFVLF